MTDIRERWIQIHRDPMNPIPGVRPTSPSRWSSTHPRWYELS